MFMFADVCLRARARNALHKPANARLARDGFVVVRLCCQLVHLDSEVLVTTNNG